MHVLLSAHGPELFLLDGLQNLGLEGEIHGVDLVQKEGATVGLLEQALPVFRAGIAPRVVPNSVLSSRVVGMAAQF